MACSSVIARPSAQTANVVEWSVYIQRGSQRPGDYEARTSWRITSPDPDKTSEYSSQWTVNHYMYANPEVDRLMAEARTTFDPTRRPQIYHESKS